MKDKLKEIIEKVTCRECAAIYGYEEHDKMIEEAVNQVVELFTPPTDISNNELYEFLYTDCIHEGGAVTQSVHRTKKGAEIAMGIHKEEERKKWLVENPTKKRQERFPFGKMEHWGVKPIELKD